MPTIIAKDRKDAARIAAELLRAAGAEGHLVRTVTTGRTPAFEVPDSVYSKWQGGEGDKGEVEQATSQGDQPTTTSTDNGTADAEQAAAATESVTAPAEAAAEKVAEVTAQADSDGAPDRNATTEAWAHYMADRFGIDTDGMTRTELIAEYDQRTGGTTPDEADA